MSISSMTSAAQAIIRRCTSSFIQNEQALNATIRHFSNFARDPRFSQVDDHDISTFKSIVGEASVITNPDDLSTFNTDWIGKYKGQSRVALKPRTTQQVSALLAHCHARNLAVVPQGGNTGLVGGSVPLFDEVIINTSLLNKIHTFDTISGILTCQSGCILENLDNHVAQFNHTVPLDLGAKGSCHIGGNVSTNAGGLRLLRYGSLHGNVLGLEVVLADGQVLDTLSTLRKDNTGYDVKQLFIGSEGTLGIITQVALLCPPRSPSIRVAYLACPSFEAATRALVMARQCLGEVLSAFEFLDRASLDITLKYLPGSKDPLPGSKAPFFVVVETSGSREEHDALKLDEFLSMAIEQGCVENGVVAQDSTQASSLWKIREGITEALRHRGAIYKYDISMPVHEMYDLVEDTRRHLFSESNHQHNNHNNNDDDIIVVGYGHLGDGNLHLNISSPSYSLDLQNKLEPWVYEWTSKRKGSISAEHGLGAMKAHAIYYSKSRGAVSMMKEIKNVFDPRGILNPYKVLPEF